MTVECIADALFSYYRYHRRCSCWASGPGTSNDKCSDLYHGPSAFSEPETKAASDYIAANKDVIKAYLDIHSYSQLVLLPWGYTTSKPDDYNDLVSASLTYTTVWRAVDELKLK
jgi:hypothetical protein